MGRLDIRANLRDLPKSLTPSAVFTGLLAVVVGYASSLVLVFQAASNAGLDRTQISSWLFAVLVGGGICTLILSIWFRQPVMAAWSTPGTALLLTSLAHYSYNEAIGAYLIAGVAILLLGISGLFGRVMALVPRSVVMGMLAGILIRFGIGLFNVLPDRPVMVLVMLITFFVLRRANFRAPTIGVLIAGLIVAALNRDVHLEGFAPALALPIFTTPQFTIGAALGLALPLFALALTSQNAPGQAVLRAANYEVPIDKALVVTGIGSILTAPMGGHGFVLAAITAAIIAGPEAHPDPDRRYAAGVAAGGWHILFGIFGATVVSLFAALPTPLIAATSGLALIGVIISSLSGAMEQLDHREGGLVALLCTAANFSLLGISAPFWGLLFGVLVHFIMKGNWAILRRPVEAVGE